MSYLICGHHTVLNCVNAKKRQVLKVYIKKGNKNLENFSNFFKNIEVVDESFFKKNFKQIPVAHQGIAALVVELPKNKLENIVSKNKNYKLICLNGVTDTRNIGSIIRTAVCFKYNGLIISKREFDEKSIPLNKSASGAMEFIDIFEYSNIKYALQILKEHNFQIISLSEKSKKKIQNISFEPNHCLILGSEENGIKKKILEYSDQVVRIDISDKVTSLNVSNTLAAAAAIANFKTT